MSKGHHNDEPTQEPAPLPEAAPAPEPAPAPLTLEERVAKLEAWIPRLEAIVGAP